MTNFVVGRRHQGQDIGQFVRPKQKTILAGVAFGMILSGGFAVAEETDAAADAGRLALEEITVTAQRHAADLRLTPLAVGTISDRDIEEKNIGQIRDLAGLIPGLFLPKTNSVGVQQVYIRGIGTSAPIYNAAVATYSDDVYVARIINSAVFAAADLERIEVLRGPQGTLYGQNSSAGAIKVISKDPSNDLNGWFSIGAGNYGAREAKLYVSAPVIDDKLAFSLAYLHQENDGYIYNQTLNRDVGAIDIDHFRAKLKFTPKDGITFVLSAEKSRDYSHNAAGTPVTYPGTGPRITFDDRVLSQRNNAHSLSLRSDFDLNENLLLRSITAYREFENEPNVWSNAGVPGDISGFELNIDQHQISQEFQLLGNYDRLQFTIGAIGFRENYVVDRPSWSNWVYRGIETKTIVESGAVYAQANYKITDRLGITGGLRYTEQKDKYDWAAYNLNADLERIALTASLNNEVHKTNSFVPKIGIDFAVTPEIFSYASLTKGTKSGGYNPVPASLGVAEVPVEPEKVTTYEAGFKGSHFGGRFRTNLSVFYNDFTDYQATVQNPIVNGVPLNITVIVNAGKAKTYGAEFDAQARVTENLDWRVAITYLKTEFTDFLNPTGAPATDFKGKELPRSPRWSIGTGFNYRVPLDIPGSLRLTGDATYIDKTFENVANTVVVPSHTLVNAGAHYRFPKDTWSLSLTVNNLLDKTFVITRTTQPAFGTDIVTYNQPRTALVTLRHDF